MYRYQSPRAQSRPNEALNEHKFILQAIRNRDEELAEMLMRRHISGSRKLIELQISDSKTLPKIIGVAARQQDNSAL